ncbi:MAG: DUF2589 domain-containing protein [Dongiaceae bacterium]
MADIQGIRALQLHELIGAPLVAMIQADALAARATLEFVESVGFVAANGQAGADDASRLRMARFRYEKLDENGAATSFVAEVPVLSLVPIPSLQIKEARLTLAAKIVDIAADSPTATARLAATASGSATPAAGAISARRLQIFAKPVASSGSKTQEVRSSFDLDIQITLGQADIPIGMEKIFALLDQAIRDEKSKQPG